MNKWDTRISITTHAYHDADDVALLLKGNKLGIYKKMQRPPNHIERWCLEKSLIVNSLTTHF